MTHSAEIDRNLNRKISIYWYNKNFIKGDVIAIYNNNPNRNNATLLFTYKPKIYRGSVKTPLTISFLNNYIAISQLNFCLEYFAAWIRNDKPRKIICLKSHRNWMYEMKNSIGPYRLSEIILPGSYKSGSYIKNLPPRESYVEKFTVTQNQDIYTQLVHGVRYIEIQPGYYPNDIIKYWSNEKCLKQIPLSRIFWDMKLFLQSTKEIILLTFRNFPEGFKNKDDYDKFETFLEEQFEGYPVMKNSANLWNLTLNEIWKSNRRLIINLDHVFESENHSLLKPRYEELENEKLIEVVRGVIYSEYYAKYNSVVPRDRVHFNVPRVVMAAVKSNYIPDCNTNTSETNSTNYRTTRSSADIISPMLLEIYNEEYYDTANVIAVNFVDAVGIVDFAIEWNRRRTSSCYSYYKSLMTPSSTYYV
ncbi:PI-PLC X domain-containing protein DDB_G0269228-like [Cotesia glomerata]|uniref:PI-PLC X domain-containing protein DDB_G0269228-like n=1 Tax=Cotesia glomerata TaxID=32391 RepID=UPI001D00EF3B|nr:PI-PLC X domain-containing protein DDB_G0269228-like [Cotesia glomerata]